MPKKTSKARRIATRTSLEAKVQTSVSVCFFWLLCFLQFLHVELWLRLRVIGPFSSHKRAGRIALWLFKVFYYGTTGK